MEEKINEHIHKTQLFRQITFISPSIKPVYNVKQDLNLNPESQSQNTFIGFILIYNENEPENPIVENAMFDWFNTILTKSTRAQNLSIFKNCLPHKQKCDQLLIESLKKFANSTSSADLEDIALHFLSFWYDLNNNTFYLYALGIFDFFLFNGNASGAPIAPLQNHAQIIDFHDLSTLSTSITQKSIHLVFENGLSSNGYFVYCGLPIEKTHPIHASPLLSRIFNRLKRDSKPESQREVEERLKKTYPRGPNSDLLDAFFYILGFVPI